MVISGSGQPLKLVYLIVLSQLVRPPRIVGLVTLDGISHVLILRLGFSSSHPDGNGGQHQPRPPAPAATCSPSKYR
jgi:hypothetical protein